MAEAFCKSTDASVPMFSFDSIFQIGYGRILNSRWFAALVLLD
jgi:hypothetical protein